MQPLRTVRSRILRNASWSVMSKIKYDEPMATTLKTANHPTQSERALTLQPPQPTNRPNYPKQPNPPLQQTREDRHVGAHIVHCPFARQATSADATAACTASPLAP